MGNPTAISLFDESLVKGNLMTTDVKYAGMNIV